MGLSHLPALSTHLIELALEEHLAILNDSYSVKRQYVSKCIDDIMLSCRYFSYYGTYLISLLSPLTS